MSDALHTTVHVRYAETDQMGVVHHRNYFVWFEIGRTALIKNIGIPYGELEKKGIMLPVIEANCRYKAAARYEDAVRIEPEIAELNPVKLRLNYRCVRERDGELLAQGYTLHMWVNREMKPLNLKRKWPDVYALFWEHFSAEKRES